VSKDIARCMEYIEAALRTRDQFCDLSQFGDPKAWEGKRLIEWTNAK